MKVYNIYKPLGKTPLEALQSLRKKLKIDPKLSLTYAGRLDPMAEGVLLILVGPTDIQKNNFLKLAKSYEVEVLFGFSSDSFDVLGLAKRHQVKALDKEYLKEVLNRYVGVNKLTLPVYSSPLVKGKPLHAWARSGMLKTIEVPSREMSITRISHLNFKKYSNKSLLKKIENKIKKVSGDFRQGKIIKCWKKILWVDHKSYISVKFIVDCESGTYIRSLADDLGKQFNSGAILFNLKRLSVDRYKVSKSVGVN